MSALKRTGIMGGTFDPPHIGHLILAQSAYEQLGLDSVLFIPAGRPPHKQNRSGATDEQRLEMVRLAIEKDPHFRMSRIEMESSDYSYTCETLKKLHERFPDEDYYFIIGQDSLETFHSWYHPEEIVRQAHIVAADRPDCDQAAFESQLEENRKRFSGDFIGIQCPDIQISSSEIRKRIAEGRSIRYFVPESVHTYILNQNIYRKENDAAAE